MPSRSRAYRTSTDQAAPKVTLKVKIVIAAGGYRLEGFLGLQVMSG